MASSNSSVLSVDDAVELRDVLKRAREACDAVDDERARCKLRALLTAVEPQLGKDRLQRGRKPTLNAVGIDARDLLRRDVSGARKRALDAVDTLLQLCWPAALTSGERTQRQRRLSQLAPQRAPQNEQPPEEAGPLPPRVTSTCARSSHDRHV